VKVQSSVSNVVELFVRRESLELELIRGARFVHVAAVWSARSWCLSVDDDGVGLAEPDGYAAGSVLGPALCRRIAARFGGALELTPPLVGGTRATLETADEAQ
jgi:signal transduction histidine kinase